MTLDMYQENILDHYAHPRNKGRLDPADISAKERNPLCGDEIEVFITLDAHKKVAEVKFDGQGCAISQAAISMLTDELKGKSLEEVERMTPDDIREMVVVPLSPVRLKCAILSLMTVHKGLATYKLGTLTPEGSHGHGPAAAHGASAPSK